MSKLFKGVECFEGHFRASFSSSSEWIIVKKKGVLFGPLNELKIAEQEAYR